MSVDDSSLLVFGADSGLDLISCKGVTTIASDTWYHALATCDQDGCSVYLNASLDGHTYEPGRKPINNGSLVLRFGREPDGNYPADGTIDDVRIYSRALSEEEIWQL